MLLNPIVLVPYKYRNYITWRVTLKVVMKIPALVCVAFPTWKHFPLNYCNHTSCL